MLVPYHRYDMDAAEEAAVIRVLRSGWLTTGPEVAAFEQEFCEARAGGFAAATLSCTTGIELLLASLELPKGAEVLVSPITFVSTVNAIVHQGLVPVFVDVVPGSLLVDQQAVMKHITPKTKAIMVTHVGGHMCDMYGLMAIARNAKLAVIEDCAHALESRFHGAYAGSFGHGGSFSFYANKNMTTGEGGMVWMQEAATMDKLKRYRNHGLDYDSLEREKNGFKQYDVSLPGYKYAMSDLPAALGRVQLAKVPEMYRRRLQIAETYIHTFSDQEGASILTPAEQTVSGWHLCQLQLDLDRLDCDRDQILAECMEKGIGLSVHFKPIHLFSYYQQHYPASVPHAEQIYDTIISLPIYPLLADEQQHMVIETVRTIITQHLR